MFFGKIITILVAYFIGCMVIHVEGASTIFDCHRRLRNSGLNICNGFNDCRDMTIKQRNCLKNNPTNCQQLQDCVNQETNE